jgi:transposase
MKSRTLATTLLPAAPGLHLARTELRSDQISATLIAAQPCSPCPACGYRSQQVHSRYQRTVMDLPWGRFTVRLQLSARKFFCRVPTCPRRIFTERLPEVVAPYARRTTRLVEVLRLLGFALGGEAGARLVARLGMAVSPATLLRLVRRASLADRLTPRVLGVDDWAFRKGHRYGTILVDLEQRRIIELLPDRKAESLARWLDEHPGVQIITRDRAQVYAEGARQGAPQATQVADCWHLLKNLGEALERYLLHHRQAIKAAGGRICAPAELPGR